MTWSARVRLKNQPVNNGAQAANLKASEYTKEDLQLKRFPCILTLLLVLFLLGCDEKVDYDFTIDAGADSDGHIAPSVSTQGANQQLQASLPFSDRQDFEDANRGLIASDPDLLIKAESGEVVWNPSAYGFIDGEAPASVNPSLWRQAGLNNIHGLFEVTPGIYQVRGYDLSNMTIIEGDSGWIVVDPLTSKETAAAAIDMIRQHLVSKPIVAIIFTHSHLDHFGGVLGVLGTEEAAAGQVRIIAPEGFMQEATSENIIAGTAMSRRAVYMYGKQLSRSERGHVGSGLGKSPAFGTFGILEPTEIIDHTPQTLEIDGLEFVFQNAPGSEAPAELTFYLPWFKAYNGAEVTSHNLHNLYTLRGAKVRDGLKWSNYIDEAIGLFGDAEVYLASHHWPVWGNERILDYLKVQRDTYKYIHDQTVRMFNAGLTAGEIAEQIELPVSLQKTFSNRGYYGTVRHNSRAVYQGYLGWYDGNPANLNPLPPVEAGSRYVEALGGSQTVISLAETAYQQAQYRWVAELLNHLVMADPGNGDARALLAKTYDQLGYQAESGPWRDVYLSAAYELRHGPAKEGIDVAIMENILRQTPVSRFFDSMAVRLNGPDAEDVVLSVNITFTDHGEAYMLEIENSVLHHRPSAPSTEADTSLKLTHDMFIRMLLGKVKLKELLSSDDLEVEGSTVDLVRFFSLFDKPEGTFNIVTP